MGREEWQEGRRRECRWSQIIENKRKREGGTGGKEERDAKS
jgi:hypothetical protein